MSASLFNELGKKKKSLKENIAEMEQVIRRNNELKIEVQTLEKTAVSINNAATVYQQSLTHITEEIKNTTGYFDTKISKIKGVISNKEEALNEIKKKKEGDIDKTKNILDESKGSVAKLQKELDIARKKHRDLQEKFELQKCLKQNIEERLYEIKMLKKEIENQDNNDNTGAMYFLLTELNDKLGEIKSMAVPHDDYKQALCDTWDKTESAKKTVKEKEDEIKTTSEDLKNAENEYVQLKQDRRNDILKKLLTKK